EPDRVGHALFDEDLIHTTGFEHIELLVKIREDSEAAFAESRRGIIRENGPVTIAFEVIFPSIELLICGSGPDVGPLVDIAAQLDWNLTVIDHRPVEYAHPERFPRARVIECPDPKSLSDTVSITRATAAVVMSHNYGRDLDYVRTLLGTEVGYIGILGPRARTERMLADIASAGETITRGDRIYSPVGLDTGGDGPERIALSIIAEVAAVISGTSAGHLRDSRGSLHPAPAREVAEKS
ncbi:MAG TPA: XdhC family protein, partial [Gemmatimonadaceae bacterium]|nr:XdhC family protein [Gemmatimonadaceae bacterium]